MHNCGASGANPAHLTWPDRGSAGHTAEFWLFGREAATTAARAAPRAMVAGSAIAGMQAADAAPCLENAFSRVRASCFIASMSVAANLAGLVICGTASASHGNNGLEAVSRFQSYLNIYDNL